MVFTMVRSIITITIDNETAQAINEAKLEGKKINISQICDQAIKDYLAIPDNPDIEDKSLKELKAKADEIAKRRKQDLKELIEYKAKIDEEEKKYKEKMKNVHTVDPVTGAWLD